LRGNLFSQTYRLLLESERALFEATLRKLTSTQSAVLTAIAKEPAKKLFAADYMAMIQICDSFRSTHSLSNPRVGHSQLSPQLPLAVSVLSDRPITKYRTCMMLTDMGIGEYSLHYLGTLDRREIDFIVSREVRPFLAVEVKSGDTLLAGSLENRVKWFPDDMPAAIQAVTPPGILQKHPNHTWVMSLHRLMSLLL